MKIRYTKEGQHHGLSKCPLSAAICLAKSYDRITDYEEIILNFIMHIIRGMMIAGIHA